MNFFPATVRRNGGASVAVEAEGLGLIPLPADAVGRPDGAAVQVALRPEKFTLSADRPAASPAVQATFATAAFLGERSHVYVRIDDRAVPVAVSVPNQVRTPEASRPVEGAPVWLSFSPESVVVLDPD
jgi:spermidine/putrescine transport system ATP-binding protein/putrescine transport system ATP-binding protein